MYEKLITTFFRPMRWREIGITVAIVIILIFMITSNNEVYARRKYLKLCVIALCSVQILIGLWHKFQGQR